MILHGFWRSSATYRVRIALGLKGVAADYRPVNITAGGQQQFSAEYLRLNPEGRVPALEVDGQVLTPSWAILEWLEEASPPPALLPADAFGRAHVRALAQLAVAARPHLHTLGPTHYS